MLADLWRFMWADVDALSHTVMASKTSAVRPDRQTLTTEQVLELLQLEKIIKVTRDTPVLTKLTLTLLGSQIRT